MEEPNGVVLALLLVLRGVHSVVLLVHLLDCVTASIDGSLDCLDAHVHAQISQ